MSGLNWYLLCSECRATGDEDGAAYCTLCGGRLVRALAPGRIVREYRIERFIAAGGMGEVYEACHVLTGERLALKRMLPEYSQDPALKRRFVEEARVMVMLRHPNIVVCKTHFTSQASPVRPTPTTCLANGAGTLAKTASSGSAASFAVIHGTHARTGNDAEASGGRMSHVIMASGA